MLAKNRNNGRWVKIIHRSKNDPFLSIFFRYSELVDGMRRGEFPDDHDLQCYTTCIMKLLRTVSEKLKRFLSSKIYQVRWINLYNTLDAFFPQFKNGNFDFDMIVKQLEITMPPEEVVIGKEIVAVCRNEGKDNKINSIFTRLDALRSVNFLSFEFFEYFTQLYAEYTGDDCQKTYQYVQCHYKQNPEKFFFPWVMARPTKESIVSPILTNHVEYFQYLINLEHS